MNSPWTLIFELDRCNKKYIHKAEMNRLPSSRAELRRRYAQPVASKPCAPRVCAPSTCVSSPCVPSSQNCHATRPVCAEPRCNCARCCHLSHPSRLEIRSCNMCVHAPYDCPTYRHRTYWCPYCISNFVFPEYNSHVASCNIPNYMQEVCQRDCFDRCSLPCPPVVCTMPSAPNCYQTCSSDCNST